MLDVEFLLFTQCDGDRLDGWEGAEVGLEHGDDLYGNTGEQLRVEGMRNHKVHNLQHILLIEHIRKPHHHHRINNRPQRKILLPHPLLQFWQILPRQLNHQFRRIRIVLKHRLVPVE